MFEYFWKQYEDLPPGLGYMRFSAEHIITLVVLFVLIVLAVRILTGKRSRLESAMKVIPWIMVCMELFKDGFLVSTGHFGPGYLPLHLCSLGLFVFIAASLSKTDKWRMIWGEIACILILPGTVAALLFPDWAHLYPAGVRAYCAIAGDAVASFCIVDQMGQWQGVKLGGPGCVGTVPAFRKRGIGLKMVENVTRILRDEGCDLSYIHFTGVAPWYAKLGYRTVLKWTGNGFL